MERIAVIIPAYNEEANLGSLIDEINLVKARLTLSLDVIVINDDSTDLTLRTAKQAGGLILDLPINLGIGGAVQTGIRYAFNNNYDYALQVDGDGQHPPAEIPKLIEAIKKTKSDIVIGSRFLGKQGFQSTFLRRMGIRYFSWLIKLFGGIKIADCTSGFRIMNRSAMALANEYYPDQYPEPESILIFALSGLKISETPVIMKPRTGGESSIRNFGAVYYTIKVTLAIFFAFIKYKLWKQ